MIKMQNLKLELISDPEMYPMIQPNIRGMRAVAMVARTTYTWERCTAATSPNPL